MPKYRITSPDGQTYEVTAPEGASEQDVLSYAHSQWASKPAKPAQQSFADAAKEYGLGNEGTMGNIAAGAGKAVVDVGRGLRQLASKIGIGDSNSVQREIDDAKRLDAPLMGTGGGMTGNILGNVAMSVLPAGAAMKAGQAMTAVPRLAGAGNALATAGNALMAPTTYGAAAGGGALMGGIQPVASDESRLTNTAIGAGGGLAGIALGRGLAAAGQGAKALAEPFYQGGRENIVGRTLNRAAGNVDDAVRNIGNAPQFVPGSVPTMAEASGDAGLAALQLSAASDPNVKAMLAKRAAENNAARLQALEGIAGAPGQRDFFDASRKTAAKQLYDSALAEQPVLTPWIKGELTKLEQRPAFGDAVKAAKVRALNEGVKLDENNVTQVVHYAKLELDNAISQAKRSGADVTGLMDTKNKLVSLIESKDFAPSYREARDTYAKMSQPINQMDLAQYMVDKVRPALMDFSENAPTRMNANAYAQAMRDSAGTVQRAIGRNGTIEGVMTPEQLATMTGVGKDLARKASADDLAKTVGSTTAQNLTTRNITRQILGPTGLPQSWAESTMLDTIMKPARLIYGGDGSAEQRTREMLTKALMDSGYGADLMTKTNAKLRLTPQQQAQMEMLAKLTLGSASLGGAAIPLSLNAP